MSLRDYAILAAQDAAPLGTIPPEYSELRREADRAIESYRMRAAMARSAPDLSLRNKQQRLLSAVVALGLLELRRVGVAQALVSREQHPSLAVACPHCQAAAGKRCTESSGRPAKRPHLARRKAAP